MAKKRAVEAFDEEDELTPEEEQAAIDRAIQEKRDARQQAVKDAEAKEAAEEEAERIRLEKLEAERVEVEQKERRRSEPLLFVGVETDDRRGGVNVFYYPNAVRGRERTIRVDDRVCEHIREDADGVWIYRHLDLR